ncbi:unnamed protein product [Hermetia illucens]|uniref:UBX domain-containing protein n=1 Tax=Hermetia illucens TaxID=343691 RepID=A0A7R8V864_HERIL|nr:UBX domain-containing protein 7 [Hermetia illucens]CAD7093922.1 unnamed protein product [Hermetia illucens]
MSDQSEDVAQLMEITGLDQAAAQSLLEMHNSNLEQAINYHLETSNEHELRNTSTADGSRSGPSSNNHGVSRTPIIPVEPGEDYVRAPIPSRKEQLVMPEDDNFRFRKRRAPAFSVCPLRNFAREAEIQEEQLNTYLDGGGMTAIGSVFANRGVSGIGSAAGYSREGYDQAANGVDASLSTQTIAKRARLEDLFRPPVELLFWGTFHAVRNYATLQNRWLIVNLQDNSEFKSQIINRDIWSDPILKELVQKHFVLWQVSVDNAEGLRFKTFYKVDTIPYICIIDPRTGENKQAFDVVTSQTFTADLSEYLETNSHRLDTEHSEPEKVSPSRSTPTSTVTRSSAVLKCSCSSSSSTVQVQDRKISTTPRKQISPESNGCEEEHHVPEKAAAELSEEDQLALAIKNSLEESQQDRENNESDENENEDVIVLSDSEEEIDSYQNYLGSEQDPVSTIQLRLPDGKRTQFEWPSTTKLRAIKLYVQSKYPEDTKEAYKVISAFPRQNILELDENISLADANLYPRAILHLHPDN